MLNKNWCPDPAFKFPLSGKRKLRFQHAWFIRWNWLVYSFKELGPYCKFCVVFGQNDGGRGCQKLGKLVLSPFNNWKDTTTKFNDHLEKDY